MSVKVMPMQKLSSVLSEVCAKFKPPVDPGSVKLALNKRVVRQAPACKLPHPAPYAEHRGSLLSLCR